LARLAAGLFFVMLAGCGPREGGDPLPSQVAVDMITVTGLDHQAIAVNPSEVVALKPPRPGQPLHQRVGCAIMTADGNFISVLEDCPEVERRLKGGK
jgi:hypothetical protein